MTMADLMLDFKKSPPYFPPSNVLHYIYNVLAAGAKRCTSGKSSSENGWKSVLDAIHTGVKINVSSLVAQQAVVSLRKELRRSREGSQKGQLHMSEAVKGLQDRMKNIEDRLDQLISLSKDVRTTNGATDGAD